MEKKTLSFSTRLHKIFSCVALYAKENKLLEEECWKQFKHTAARKKHLIRLVKQARLRSFRVAVKYKFGYEVPKNYARALELNTIASNHKWRDANLLEHKKLAQYKLFKDKGKFSHDKVPRGFQLISVHTIYNVKHDARHRARVVANNGHLTDIPLESVYSGIVSLRGLRTCIFLAELNDMEPWATDISSAYLEAYTTKNVYIRAGPEFNELEGHLLIIIKALYGLRLSGNAFNQLLVECLQGLGFVQSLAQMKASSCVPPSVEQYMNTLLHTLLHTLMIYVFAQRNQKSY